MKYWYKFIAIIGVILTSCENKSTTTVSFPQRIVVENFPKNESLSECRSFSVEAVGVIDIAVKNRLLLLASSSDRDKYISAYSLDDGAFIGNALKKGRANGELRGAKSFGALGLRTCGDKLYSYTFDGQNNLIRIDLSESFKQEHTVFDLIIERAPLEIPRAYYCNDSLFLITSAADDFKSRIRSLLNVNGVNDVPEHLKFLNKVSVKNPDDINVLSTLVAFDSERQLVVEAGLQQNSIQLYSLYDDFARTIIIGKHLMSIEQLAAERDDLIRDQYVHINAYDSYFAALYYDATEEEQYKEEKLPRLQFFSWNGDPICELLVPFPASSFDIDHSKGKMYFLDRISESINECPLPDYLIRE